MNSMRMGKRIQQHRLRRKLTQQQLADRAKIHRVYLANVERGARVPSLGVLGRIAKALRTTLAELVR